MAAHEFEPSEVLHRLVKQAIDSGAATNIAEAQAIFQGYKLNVAIGEKEALDPGNQAALLTTVALARRVFLGGVFVDGAVDVNHCTQLPLTGTLADAVVALGGTLGSDGDNTPVITIGGGIQARSDRFHIRTAYAGWRGGIVPGYAEVSPAGSSPMPLAASLAAALGVNEAFLHVSGKTPAAGRRSIGMSLWRPEREIDWLAAQDDEPELKYLPTRLWLIGLGHLGQSFLWALGLLTYPTPAGLHLVLQDVDVITPATESTSILSDHGLIGKKKTRAMADWAERRGFTTAIYERLFDSSYRRQAIEPAVALCGLDNALGRKALDSAGFDFIVEAGLGRGHRDFRTIRLHSLPGTKPANELWKVRDTSGEKVHEAAAYKKLMEEGVLDKCGVTLLAGKAVGAPFVGAVAASLAIAEVLRLLHGGPVYQVIDLDLQSVEHRTAILHTKDFKNLNPGFTTAAPPLEQRVHFTGSP
jgi:hypothetical protein